VLRNQRPTPSQQSASQPLPVLGAPAPASFVRSALGDGAREWWPAFLAREDGPQGRPDPADWIVSDRKRRLLIDGIAPSGERPILGAGSVVAFRWRECRAAVEVTIAPDGSIDPHGPLPRDATHFWDICDSGTVMSSLDELALFHAEGLTSPVRLRVRMCRWSPRDVLLRLDVAGGRPRFVAEASQARLAS
jgi:hypothetical protein